MVISASSVSGLKTSEGEIAARPGGPLGPSFGGGPSSSPPWLKGVEKEEEEERGQGRQLSARLLLQRALEGQNPPSPSGWQHP